MRFLRIGILLSLLDLLTIQLFMIQRYSKLRDVNFENLAIMDNTKTVEKSEIYEWSSKDG